MEDGNDESRRIEERDLLRLNFDRLENSYNQGYQRITIALAVANAALGLILLAPEPGTLETLVKSTRQQWWVWSSIGCLGVAIVILLVLSISRLEPPITIEGFDSRKSQAESEESYTEWEASSYAAAIVNGSRKLLLRKNWISAAIILTTIGIGLYIVSRCAV